MFPFSARCAFFLLAALAISPAAGAQPAQPPPSVTVSGQAEIRVVPDEAVFTLEVERVDKDLPTAQRLNDESVRQILDITRRFEIPQQDVKTDYISVEMRYSEPSDDEDDARPRPARREFLGYAVSKTAVIRAKDLARFDALFSELLRAGVSRVRGVEFRTSQLRKHKDEARAQAVRAAREKADAMARELGQRIGKALNITEEGFARNAASNNYSAVVSGSFSAEDDETAFAPGTIAVTARVSVSFQLL